MIKSSLTFISISFLVLMFQDNCVDPVDITSCTVVDYPGSGTYRLEIINETGNDLDVFIAELDTNNQVSNLNCAFGNTSTIEDDHHKEIETILFNSGDAIYYRADLKGGLSGLQVEFSDSVITDFSNIQIRQDTLHYWVKIDSLITVMKTHAKGHVCPPGLPCGD